MAILGVNLTSAFCQSATPLPPQEKFTTNILFIFDASQSMAGQWESDKKITIARKVLTAMIDSLEKVPHVQMALRIYGHQSPVPPQDCSDTKLEVPFSPNNAGRIRQELQFLIPKGTTPMANSLLKGGQDFPKNCEKCRNVIILITDGIEACDGDPCFASRELQRMGITLKPFVIGIGIDENFSKSFECIGQFYNAKNESQFNTVLNVVISLALNSTTAQVNLLDSGGSPSETDVNMTFFDQLSGKVYYNFIHTINNKGNPDTLVLDPLVTYKLKVHTIPPVEKDSIKVLSGKHTIISLDTPQGYLKILSKGDNQYRGLQTIVRQAGKTETLTVQAFESTEKYLTGKYDLEVLTLPRIMLSNVEIKQSHTTTIDIPRPGLATFLYTSHGFGSIYVLHQNNQQWVCNLNSNSRSETVLLQPGHYRVVYRPANAKQVLYTVSKTFEIVSGSSKVVELY